MQNTKYFILGLLILFIILFIFYYYQKNEDYLTIDRSFLDINYNNINDNRYYPIDYNVNHSQKLKQQAITNILSSPKKVIYIDGYINNWSDLTPTFQSAVNGGYNVIILAFFLPSGDNLNYADIVQAWSTQPNKQKLLDWLHQNNTILLGSVGGSTYNVTQGGNFGKAAGIESRKLLLDGIDFDVEGYTPNMTDEVLHWTAQLAIDAKNNGASVVTFAPQGPYFSPMWAGPKGYGYVESIAGNYIDWYNVQYYNQGDGTYSDFKSLFIEATPDVGNLTYKTSIGEIASGKYPVNLNKLVLGKPAYPTDGNQYLTPKQMITIMNSLLSSHMNKWRAGMMFWQNHTSTTGPMNPEWTTFLKTYFPGSSPNPSPYPFPPNPSPYPFPPIPIPEKNRCLTPWDKDHTYNAKDEVCICDKNYVANYNSQGLDPRTNNYKWGKPWFSGTNCKGSCNISNIKC